MSDETALLRAIAQHPGEDTPRLAYADWLDEMGRAERAEFIRAQIELAGLAEDSNHRRTLAFRCRQLLDAHDKDWAEPFDCWHWAWSRGFVEAFTTTPTDLDGSSNAQGRSDQPLFETNPFRRVWVWELKGKVDGVSLIPANNRITALDLTGNNLNVTQLKKLAKMTHFPHLRELGLMFNALHDTAVKVLCGEAFFQRLDLIRLGANPFSDRGRDLLRAHFGTHVTFNHDREPERLYTIQDDYLRVGWGKNHTQLLMLSSAARIQVALFDHAGNLLGTEERLVKHRVGDGPVAQDHNRAKVRDKWLKELGYRSAPIKVKRFKFDDGSGITPFNWYADCYDGQYPADRPGLGPDVESWIEWGRFQFDFVTDNAWFFDDGKLLEPEQDPPRWGRR